MPKQNGLNLRKIYDKLNEMSAEISVLNDTLKDIKQSQNNVPNESLYEHLPPNSAIFWDGYWSPKRSSNSLPPRE
jgi:hypothetical protein